MGVLGRAALAALALGACYEPALVDCKIACESADDCAGDQVCGSDGLCAAPAIAGSCAHAMAGPDAGIPTDAMAAPAIDGPPPIDAPAMPMVALRVQVEGKGSIVIAGVGTCSSDDPAKGDCTYNVPTGTQRSARAVPQPDQQFTRWTSLVCGGQGATCSFTPFLFTSITAKFDKARP